MSIFPMPLPTDTTIHWHTSKLKTWMRLLDYKGKKSNYFIFYGTTLIFFLVWPLWGILHPIPLRFHLAGEPILLQWPVLQQQFKFLASSISKFCQVSRSSFQSISTLLSTLFITLLAQDEKSIYLSLVLTFFLIFTPLTFSTSGPHGSMGKRGQPRRKLYKSQ